MTATLTPGGILTAYHLDPSQLDADGRPPALQLQVLHVKHLVGQGNASDRYKLILSDGTNFMTGKHPLPFTPTYSSKNLTLYGFNKRHGRVTIERARLDWPTRPVRRHPTQPVHGEYSQLVQLWIAVCVL